ncbi:MAG: hypothetical protein KAZ36_10700, partial [Bacteroidales bacterium]|nr:hypothetical protein [Bacteroidales bacterium]
MNHINITPVITSAVRRGLLVVAVLICNNFFVNAQVQKAFTQRTSVYTPTKTIYNIKGDFTMIGNTNMTLEDYEDDRLNSNNVMIKVDADSDPSTINSSMATLVFSSENGAIPECSNIIYAGLYWTARTNSSVTTTEKRAIKLKGPGSGSYTSFNAAVTDIQYPGDNYMYAGYIEVTDYVRAHGVGQYWVADMALTTGNGGSTGYYGGWGMIVVYENSKMKWRDVTIFDGYAYVVGNTSVYYDLPISGFTTVQSGQVDMKLGLMAGEGDVGIYGDYFQIRKVSDATWMSLNHGGNATNNFFNSSIYTGGNTRNPNLLNNTGMDVSMFNIPNPSNTVITNNQTSTTFRYGSTQDTYIIFCIAMAVDAYVPTPEGLISVNSIGGSAPSVPPVALPGQEIEYKVEIKNKGTEPIINTRIVIPMPYSASYVSCSGVVNFTPLPTPNNLYFDPTLGATGSIVWDFGTLPLPADPNTVLATLTFRINVTTNCKILMNPNCPPDVPIYGTFSGTGATSSTSFTGYHFIQGFQTSGLCQGEPIYDPIHVAIDAADYIAEHCQGTPAEIALTYCNVGTTIPVTEVLGNFPPGSRFYDSYPVTSSSIEYTISNPFPATSGTHTYYAVVPGIIDCYFIFTITVTNITTVPSVSPLSYCLGQAAVPLTATATNPSYLLYYYTSLSSSEIPQMSITPSTAAVGSTTYYVAEGVSASCISPNRAPLVVTVNLLPVVTVTGNSPVCVGSNLFLVENGGEATSWSWTGPNGFTSTNDTAIILGAGLANDGIYTVTISNGICSNSASINADVSMDPIVVEDCPDDITVCADTMYGGELGAFVDWDIPDFSMNCMAGLPGSSNNFVMGFELPEVKWACWEFNKVQRIGPTVVNLWQSTGTGNPHILTPSVYIEPPLSVEMDIICEPGRNFTWSVYLVRGVTESFAGSVYVNTSGHYSVAIPGSFASDIYRLKFVFSGNGNNKCAVDNIYFDGILMDLGDCVGGIEFNVTGPIPGFYSCGDTNLVYTATYTPPVGTPLTETCSFIVNVECVSAQVTSVHNTTCSLNNGSITITAQSNASAHNFEYLVNGGIWTAFGAGNSTVTISNLPAATYQINIRELGHAGDCEILDPLTAVVGITVDTVRPVISCPGNINLVGCSTDVITGLVYSETVVPISAGQFASAGGSASDNCGIVYYSYQDSKTGNCPIVVSRIFTVRDLAGNTKTCTQTIQIIHNTPPVVPSNGSAVVYCLSAATAPTLPTVTDACGNPVNAVLVSIVTLPDPMTCEGTRAYTYRFTDCANLSTDWVFTYTIEREDFTMPANPAPQVVACAADLTAPTLRVITDNCDNILTPTGPVISTIPACEGNVTYTYTYTDCEGNHHDWVYTYTIEREDFTMPANPAPQVVACADDLAAPNLPVITDNCGTILTPTGPVISTIPACEGNVTYTYTYTDCEGNHHDWVYTYTIE